MVPVMPETPEALAFYAAHSPFPDPGDLARAYADLPRDPAQLARVSRDLLIHRVEGDTPRTVTCYAPFNGPSQVTSP